MNSALRLATAILLCSAGAAHADTYAFEMNGQRFALICEGTGVIDTPCKIQVGQGNPPDTTPLRFANMPTRYPHLLKEAVEKASLRKDFPLDREGIALLRGLLLEKCYRDADYHGDLYAVCIPTDSSRIAFFARGLCDRCNFEPIVLKRLPAAR